MAKIDFNFRKKLNAMIGGELHSYCFQCGACVGDCPAARYSPRFNPRRIMLQAILGQADPLLAEDSVIWDCTNCYNCYERCPQDVRPVEVIMALKNMTHKARTNPQQVNDMVKAVQETGRTVVLTSAVDRRRGEMGLEKMGDVPMDEIRKLMQTRFH